MTSAELHPWVSTPEALRAAGKAIQVPLTILPKLSTLAGEDALRAQALVFLRECALTPRDRGLVRDYNDRDLVPYVPHGYVGSMHEWPEDERIKYAIRTIGYALNNWLRVNARGILATQRPEAA